MIIGKIKQAFQQLIQTTKELDKVMVDLQIVTGTNRKEAKALLGTYNELALEIGRSTTSVASASNDWLRAGYEGEEAANLIKASMYLSTLGMEDSTQATTQLISSLKGWKLQASEVMGVVDKLTAVDMEAAISAGGLAQAMAEGNNMARTAGASMNWYAGALAAVTSNTQLDPTRVGTAYRTMFSRYANVKSGKFVATESEKNAEGFDESDYEDLNDVEKVLGKLGINIRSGGSFKNIEVVFSEIAKRWSALSDVEKSAIATALAGTRQREVMVATFENWNEVLALSTIAANSNGIASKKMEAYNESLAASQERVTAEFEKLTMGVGMQDILKGVNNILAFIIKNLGKIIVLLGAIATFSNLGAFTSSNSKNKGNIIGMLSRLSVYGTSGSVFKMGVS